VKEKLIFVLNYTIEITGFRSIRSLADFIERRLPHCLLFSFTITRGKIVAIDLVADPERLRKLDVAILGSS